MEKKGTIVEAEDKEIYLGRVKIQKGGYFTIPKKVREHLDIHAGDKVILRELDNDPLGLFELIKA